MTKLVPVEDPAVLQQLNGSPPTDGQPSAPAPAKFLGGTKENWMDQIPPALTGLGGVGGAAVGAASGLGVASIPGAIAGGAMGAGGGQYLGDVILNALKSAGIYQGGQQKPTEQMVEGAVKTGALDAGLSMGMPVVGRAFQGAKSAILGVGQQGLDAYRAAGEHGINLGLSDVAQRALPRLYEKVIGSFPLMGGPIRRAYDRKIGEVDRATGNVVESIGEAKGISESGREMTDAVKAEFDRFKAATGERYNAARQAASAASMKTDNLKRVAGEIVGEWDAQAVGGVQRQEPPVVAAARQYAAAPDTISFQQYEGMADELDRLIDLARRDGYRFGQGLGVMDALKADRATLSDPAARQALDEADAFFAEGRKKFDTVTGQQFGKVDRNIFRPGFDRPGSINADEVFTRAFDTRSPQAMKELRSLVGEDAFNNALASHIERKLSSAATEQVVRGDPRQVLSAQKAGEALGFANPKSPEFSALAAAFNVAGKPDGVRALKQFLDAVSSATERGAPNVSQFLARRGVMGGVGALESAMPFAATALAAEGGGIKSALGTLLGFVAANRLSNRLSDPKFLREMAIIVDPKNPDELREAVLKRILSAQVATPFAPNPMDSNGR